MSILVIATYESTKPTTSETEARKYNNHDLAHDIAWLMNYVETLDEMQHGPFDVFSSPPHLEAIHRKLLTFCTKAYKRPERRNHQYMLCAELMTEIFEQCKVIAQGLLKALRSDLFEERRLNDKFLVHFSSLCGQLYELRTWPFICLLILAGSSSEMRKDVEDSTYLTENWVGNELIHNTISELARSQEHAKGQLQNSASIDVVKQRYNRYKTVIGPVVDRIWDGSRLMRRFNIESSLVNSLSFREIAHRYDAIPQAQAKTFQWLLDPSSLSQASGDSFARWLTQDVANQDGLYWLYGKPGSGKSTLMRFLNDQAQTKALAQRWASGRRVYLSSCYFWAAGTDIQKSLHGILRTLLYKLTKFWLDVYSQQLFPSRYALMALGGHPEETWTVSELQSALVTFSRIHAEWSVMLLLVDGLDEFESSNDERKQFCRFLRELSKEPNVKICASSRPWNVYKDAFSNAPSLCLEFLTKQDISIFVEDKFLTDTVFRQWYTAETEHAQQIMNEVVRKAEGVFLWVRIVVQSLLSGIENGDDIHELSRTLTEIPSDLEDLFGTILDRISQRNREAAFTIFQLVLRGEFPVMLHYFSHNSIDTNVPAQLDTEEKPPSECRLMNKELQNSIEQRQQLEMRRINARSLGLLQFDIRGAHEPPLRVVSFMHRTAQDFIASPTIMARIKSWKTSSSNIDVLAIQACARLLQMYGLYKAWLPTDIQLQMTDQMISIANQHNEDIDVLDAMIDADYLFNPLEIYQKPNVQATASGQPTITKKDRAMACAHHLDHAWRTGQRVYVLARLKRLRRDDLNQNQLDDLLRSFHNGVPEAEHIQVLLRLGAKMPGHSGTRVHHDQGGTLKLKDIPSRHPDSYDMGSGSSTSTAEYAQQRGNAENECRNARPQEKMRYSAVDPSVSSDHVATMSPRNSISITDNRRAATNEKHLKRSRKPWLCCGV